ncbi:MAG: shikimate dehydrogenase, partial [Opitutaceae bacterium]|nr:shikimate dehydrogenase [Opitutaceae bacterium]
METPRTVFSLDDLRRWNAPGVSLAVAGHPIAHSLSPRMHNAALRELSGGRPAFRDWRYHAFDIPPSGLAEALGLFHAKGFRGLNITVPHKVAALAAIGDATEGARLAGAVNTLEWLPGGWRGHNTDAHGFSRAVGEEFALSLAGVPVLLLGA